MPSDKSEPGRWTMYVCRDCGDGPALDPLCVRDCSCPDHPGEDFDYPAMDKPVEVVAMDVLLNHPMFRGEGSIPLANVRHVIASASTAGVGEYGRHFSEAIAEIRELPPEQRSAMSKRAGRTWSPPMAEASIDNVQVDADTGRVFVAVDALVRDDAVRGSAPSSTDDVILVDRRNVIQEAIDIASSGGEAT
jgi:hypothetical protein